MAKSYSPILTNARNLPTEEDRNALSYAEKISYSPKPMLAQTRKEPAQPKPIPVKTSFGGVLDEYNTSLPGIGRQVAQNLAPERKQEIAQGTQRFFEQAPVQAGFMQGFALNNPVESLERKLGTDIDTTQAEQSTAYKIGQGLGIASQFAIPYAGASGAIGKATAKLLPNLPKLGQKIAGSVATDLAVGLPLNVSTALNKERLRGEDAMKNIALNTGIDIVAGGVLEAAPAIAKMLKKTPQNIPTQAPTKPVQPVLPQKGTETPKAQEIPTRNNFVAETSEKVENAYKEFMRDTEGLPDFKTGIGEIAAGFTDKGVTRSKDVFRNIEAATRNNPVAKQRIDETFTKPFVESKGRMATEVKTKLDSLYKGVVQDLGIKKGSKEDAAIQWIGEGQRQVKVPVTQEASGTKLVPYTLEDLRKDFSYKMPNGRPAYENILAAEKQIRDTYTEYVDRINEALKKIYPNVEENVKKLQDKLAKTTDPEARKAVQQEIEDAIVGKRLMPRKDYFRHFKEQQQGFLVGLDNVINGATNIDPRLIGVSEFTKPNSKWTGILQRRKGGDVYTESGLGGILEYIPQAEYKINIEPNIPVLRNIVKELKENTINSKNANGFIDIMMQFTNDLAGKTNQLDRSFVNAFANETTGRRWLNTLSTLSNRMRKNAVMGNFNSMIAQFFNMPNVVGYAKNPVDVAEGFGEAIKAALGNPQARETLAKSDFLRERYIDRSFRQFNVGMLDNVEKFFSWTMEMGDKAIADGAFLTFYKQAIKKGMPDAEAVRFADDLTRKSIAGRGIGEMPLSQKAKVTKMFTPFQVEVRNAVNVLKDLGSQKDIAGIMGVFVTSFIMNEILKATTGREIGFNPIGTAVDSAQDGSNFAYGLIGNALTNYPGGSYVASAGANALGLSEYQMQELFGQNDPSRFGTGNIAIQTLGAPIGQAVNGQNIDVLKPLTSTLPRFGGKQLERGIRGLQDMAVLPREQINLQEGISAETQDFPASYSQSGRLRFPIEPTLPNYLTAPTLGTWSTPEGKAYIENERQPLGNKQTALIERANKQGVSPIKLTKAYNDIKGLTKKDDIVNQLRRSKLTTREINLILEQKGMKPIEGR